MNAPCKGCRDRAVGCHGYCERYKTYRAKINEPAEIEQKRKNATRASFEGRKRVMKSKNKVPKNNA